MMHTPFIHTATTSTSKPVAKPQMPEHKSASGNPPKFGMSMKDFVDRVDFKELAKPHVNQIQIIYTCCILWRLLAANQRRKASPTKSWNEMRESAMRDSLGFFCWFFGTPLLQRAYLNTMVPKDIKQALIQKNPQNANEKGFWNFIKRHNPLYNSDIPSSEQVKDQMEQALADLKLRNIAESDAAYKTTKAFYEKLTKYRNLATGVGLIATIGLLGIGINLFNFYMTRKNVEQRKASLKNMLPTGSLPSMGTLQHLNPMAAHPFRPLPPATMPMYPNHAVGMPPHPLYNAFMPGVNSSGH